MFLLDTTQLYEQSSMFLTILFTIIMAELTRWLKNLKASRDEKKTNETNQSSISEILATTKAMSEKFAKIEEDIASVKKEVTFNGGSSMKDKINEMQGLQEMRFHMQLNSQPTPTFMADKSGEYIFSNTALSELFGMHYIEMKGSGWLLAVGENQKEKDDVSREWRNAVKNDIPFEMIYTVVNQRNMTTVRCRAKSTAHRKANGELMYYMGTIQQIK